MAVCREYNRSQRSLEFLEKYVFEHMRFTCTFSSKEGPKYNSPWLTPDLKKLMFERDKAKKLVSRAGSSETWMHFNALRNKVNTAISTLFYFNVIQGPR